MPFSSIFVGVVALLTPRGAVTGAHGTVIHERSEHLRELSGHALLRQVGHRIGIPRAADNAIAMPAGELFTKNSENFLNGTSPDPAPRPGE